MGNNGIKIIESKVGLQIMAADRGLQIEECRYLIAQAGLQKEEC